MLKNYAMLGIATDASAAITVTDNDLIEKSNLNRQFLFRNKDLQQPKSVSAGNAVKVWIILNISEMIEIHSNISNDYIYLFLDRVLVNEPQYPYCCLPR